MKRTTRTTNARRPDAAAARLCGAALLALLPLAGCITSRATGGGAAISAGDDEVVERSKEQPPGWCALDARRLHETPDAVRYVEGDAGLLDLPLGIKQTQLKALTGSRAALLDAARRRLQALASDQGAARAGTPAAAELERYVAAAVDEVHARHARVSDLYFEKRRGGGGETYGVLVLIQMPRAGLDELVRAVARRCAQSSDAGLKRLAQALIARPAEAAGGFSH